MSRILIAAGEVLATVPTPTAPPFDPNDVTPGPIGFLAIFAMFLLVSAVAFDLIRRVRRMKYREIVREKLEREIAERDAVQGAAVPMDASAEPDATDEPGASAEPGATDEPDPATAAEQPTDEADTVR